MSSVELQGILTSDAGLWLLVALVVSILLVLGCVVFSATNEVQ